MLAAIAICAFVPASFSYALRSDVLQAGNQTPRAGQGFEVATIKPADEAAEPGRFIKLEGTNRFTARNYTLKLLIAAAYDMNPMTISGGPGWMESDHFDILALTPGQTRPSRKEQMSMLQKLLTDRFHLAFHREQKEFSIYTLEVAKDGPKLKATALGPDDPSTVGPGMVYPEKVVMPASNATMSDFTSLLQRAVLDRPVVDRTGLTGRYDFSLEWAPDERQFGGALHTASDDAPSPRFFTAVQEQLGLKLEAGKGSVSAMVVDRAERPTPN